ncbi:MAG: TraR/DksA family transcriptional regulator [Alphaproteobacteria bacterium]|nr:TraR/DksA family transcriptional regulator [Alphaproteobacteria bacterium]
MDKDTARSRLVARLAELGQRIDKLDAELMQPLPADWEEQAVELADDEAQVALEAAGRRETGRIVAALARIDAGTWGDCVRCGAPIDPRRLEADPSAPSCVGCSG